MRSDIKAQLIQEKIFAKVTSNVKVSDSELQKYYDQHQSQYGTPEQRDVAHILVKTKALADKLYSARKGGENFAKLAKQYSQDPGSKDKGGKLTITKGTTVGAVRPDRVPAADRRRSRTRSRPTSATTSSRRSAPSRRRRPRRSRRSRRRSAQQLLQQKKSTATTSWSTKLKKDYDGKVSYQTGYAPPPTTTAATTTNG